MNISGERIHCLGIGGIGVSAVAGLCKAMGAVVSGCDTRESDHLLSLRLQGYMCLVGHSPEHVKGMDAVVHSSAVPREHEELRAARALGIPVYTRAQMLARLQQGKRTIAIAGAHGKTTTTWLAAQALIAADLKPSIMVGGRVAALGGNWCLGEGPLFVSEVDESDGSLLEFEPTWSIITNIDLEHLDYYRGFDHIRETFARYVRRTRPDGCVIACADDAEAAAILRHWPGRRLTYGLNASGAMCPDFAARNVRLDPLRSRFEVEHCGRRLGPVTLTLPGEHNVQNSLAIFALAHDLGIPFDDVARAFARATGVGRRLQFIGEWAGVAVIDDYAHHPREVKATLQAARRMAMGRLIGVFQPHRYTRTRYLCADFGAAFDEVDHLFLAPIYAASEAPQDGVSSQLIADAVQRDGLVGCEVMADLSSIAHWLLDVVRPGDTVITLGAGDVYRVGEELLRLLKEVGNPSLASK